MNNIQFGVNFYLVAIEVIQVCVVLILNNTDRNVLQMNVNVYVINEAYNIFILDSHNSNIKQNVLICFHDPFRSVELNLIFSSSGTKELEEFYYFSNFSSFKEMLSKSL